MRLGELTSPAVADARGRILLVPVGSCEQHGPHLPLQTDTLVAVAVAEGVAAERPDVLVAPAVAYGSSGEHQSFAGTLSIGAAALTALLVELGRSAVPDPAASSYHGLVFVNGHGGNAGPVRTATELLVAEGRPVSAWSPHLPGGDAHAGRTETSLLLAIAVDAVGDDRPVGDTRPLGQILDALRDGGVGAVSPSGVLGDARGASVEEGRELLRALVDDLASRLPGRS